MAIIRWLVGRIVLLINFITQPKSPKLTAEQQADIAEKTAHLSLYQLPACPFCVKVRRAMKRQGIDIELKNIKDSQQGFRDELVQFGGKPTVPCLRIAGDGVDASSAQWLYESNDIIAYLENLVKK
ncbi:glutaredoxin family protein [Colwellia sp. MEBiC06753]